MYTLCFYFEFQRRIGLFGCNPEDADQNKRRKVRIFTDGGCFRAEDGGYNSGRRGWPENGRVWWESQGLREA